MMQFTACPFPCKEEPQIKEEIIDDESTDYCFTHSSAITNTITSSGAVISLHNTANTLPKPIVSLIPVTPVTPVTPAAHVTPVTPFTPAVPITPATEVPNNTGFQLRMMTKGKLEHEKAQAPTAKECSNDGNTTEGLKFTEHLEKKLPNHKRVIADVYFPPEHDNILETYFQKRPYISLAGANNIYKKHGIPRNVTKAWFEVKRARRRRGATSASERLVICVGGPRVTVISARGQRVTSARG